MKLNLRVLIAAIAIAISVPIATFAASFFYVGNNGNLGIGTDSPQTALDVVGAIYSRLFNATDASSLTIDWSKGNVQALTLSTSNTTLTFSNGQMGGEYKLILHQDATGGRTVTWPTSVRWVGGLSPVLSSVASSTDVTSFIYDDGNHYLGSYAINYSIPRIAFDNAITQQTNSGGNSLTFSYTTSGNNRYLFVGCLIQSSQTITGITYGGVSMTQINSLNTSNVSANETSYLFGLAAPAAGANNVVVTGSGATTIACAASSYTNAQQTTAVEANNTSTNSLGGTSTVSITTVTDKDWLVGFARGDGTPTAGANTQNRGNSLVDMMDTNGVQTPAGSHSMNYTGSTNGDWLAAALKPAQ